jgi:hypothetical protein
MVFTNAQTTAFFTDPAQMALPDETYDQLAAEGITTVDDLSEFVDDDIKQITENLRRPAGRVPIDPANLALGTMPHPPFVLGAKSLNCLKAAGDIIRYYDTTDRALTPTNMRWDPVIKSFTEHWKSLLERKKQDKPEVPKITRGLPVVKWSEAFNDWLFRVIGARHIPLAYCTRETADVPAEPPLATNQPFSAEHGSVEAELIARASHHHPLFQQDNSDIYYGLEEATRGTIYAVSIKPFQRAKNGRGALAAMISQYAGEDKWRALIKQAEDLIHSRRWKGQQTNYSLEKFIGQHRTAHVNVSQCSSHDVNYQVPNETSRVTYLLTGIECMHPPLQAAMALVLRSDQAPTGKMNDFEATASFLLPHDPVATKRNMDKKRPAADISELNATQRGAEIMKARSGKTGVEFRFHTYDEYDNLTQEQKAELDEYRDSRESQGLSRKLPKIKGKGG